MITLRFDRWLGWMPVWLLCLNNIALAADLPDFTRLVEANRGAVVNISTTPGDRNGAAAGEQDPKLLPDEETRERFGDLLRKFFGDQDQDPFAIPEHSLGSGFVISDDGYILTNYHVIADAGEIFVRLADRRELAATLVGSDMRSDVALLKVAAKGLPVAKPGDSSVLKVGEWVLAIGSPFGFDYSVTAGIVSAIGRSLPNENYVPFIQTDVAINPGNSGGPLYNMQGEVIGINSQIFSRTGGFMGLSFAIPIELAMDVAQQLKTKGKVSRGWLGVMVQEVTQELAESFDMDRPHGALVSQVVAESPAAKAGIKAGDVLVSFADEVIETSASLPPVVGRTPLGQATEVKVLRQGKELALSVSLTELVEENSAQAPEKNTPSEQAPLAHKNVLDIAVGDLSPERRNALNLAADAPGVAVTTVRPGPGQNAGLMVDDVIVQLGNEVIVSPEDFYKKLEQWPVEKPVALLLQREDGPQFLAVPTKP
jgi:serine protease Do